MPLESIPAFIQRLSAYYQGATVRPRAEMERTALAHGAHTVKHA